MKAYTHPSGHLRLSLTKEEAGPLLSILKYFNVGYFQDEHNKRDADIAHRLSLDIIASIKKSQERADLKKYHEQFKAKKNPTY